MTPAEFKAATRRQAGGRKAKKAGDDSEGMVLGLCDEYLKQGRAKLEKVDPPTKVVGRPPRIIYQRNPFLDLVGTWTEKQGRALFLEVKSTTSHRLPISRPNGLTKDQLGHLRAWSEAGATVALLWVHSGGLKVITLETIEDAAGRENPSIPWGDFPLCRRGPLPSLRWDFLSEIADE